jgi:hypothetical protein
VRNYLIYCHMNLLFLAKNAWKKALKTDIFVGNI